MIKIVINKIIIIFICLVFITGFVHFIRNLYPASGLNLMVFESGPETKNPEYIGIDYQFKRELRNKLSGKIEQGKKTEFIWKGFLFIPESGTYQFSTISKNHSRIYLDDFLMVDNGGNHPIKSVFENTVLSRGIYRLKIEYFPVA